MKTLLLLLFLCVTCQAGDTYETYETNWITGDIISMVPGKSYRVQQMVIKTNYQYVRTNVICMGFATNFHMLLSNLTLTNPQYPCRFQPQNGAITTNIIINSNYVGTIQVGERFYHVEQQEYSKIIKANRQVIREVE